MKHSFNPTRPLPTALLGALAIVTSCWLQAGAQEDPFGAAPPPAAPKAEDPFGKGAAAPAADGEKAEGPVEPARVGPESPVVLQVRESNPTTPAQLLSAAETTLQFGRPDEAKRYLALLIAARPTSEALAPLATEFSIDTLSRIAREPQVQPEGRRVTDVILAAAEKVARDPARILALVPLLTDADPQTRSAALGQLQKAGAYAIPPLLKVLADPKQENVHRDIRSALTSLGQLAEQPLLGALATNDLALRAQLMIVLGRMRSDQASLYMLQPALDPATDPQLHSAARAALEAVWGKLPSRSEARRLLLREIETLLAGRPPLEVDEAGTVELWSWDEATFSPQARQWTRQDASKLLANRLTVELLALAPERRDYLTLRLLAGLEWERTRTPDDQPLPRGAGTLHELAVRAGPEIISNVLADATYSNKVAAARGAVEILAEIGTADMLTLPGAESPLTKAMLHPDQQLRIEAALAIVKLNPPQAFAGASRVTDVLAHAASTRGVRRLMIANPRLSEARDIIGYLSDLGFDGEVYLSGQALVKAAVADPDVELILVSDAIDRPPVHELVQVLRKDYRTADLLIGVTAVSEGLDRSRFLLKHDPRTIVVPRIAGPEAAAFAANHLGQRIAASLDYAPDSADVVEKMTPITTLPLGSPTGDFAERDARIARGVAALQALTLLAESKENFNRYDLLRAEPAAISAVGVSALSSHAAALLARTASPRAQSALIEIASQSSRPLADREAAAAAFAAAVKQRGLLLTTDQIRAQYAVYNSSETLDPDTQRVLGSLLDVMEAQKTTAAAIGEP